MKVKFHRHEIKIHAYVFFIGHGRSKKRAKKVFFTMRSHWKYFFPQTIGKQNKLFSDKKTQEDIN